MQRGVVAAGVVQVAARKAVLFHQAWGVYGAVVPHRNARQQAEAVRARRYSVMSRVRRR